MSAQMSKRCAFAWYHQCIQLRCWPEYSGCSFARFCTTPTYNEQSW